VIDLPAIAAPVDRNHGAKDNERSLSGSIDKGHGAFRTPCGRRPHGLVTALARTDTVHKLRAERQHACCSATVRRKRAAQLGVPAELWQQAFAVRVGCGGSHGLGSAGAPNPPETGPGDAAGARSLFPAAPAASDR
jgi:hypothetical protein